MTEILFYFPNLFFLLQFNRIKFTVEINFIFKNLFRILDLYLNLSFSFGIIGKS